MSDSVRGACLCAAVAFEVAPPFHWLAHCHCSMCRKHHGTLFGTGLGVGRVNFSWISGEREIVHYRSTDVFERAFCGRCGSKVPSDSHLPDVLLVPAGTLDGDFLMRPRSHIFVGSKSSLTTINDALPQFAAYPPGVDLPIVERSAAPAQPGIVAGGCLCGDVAFEAGGDIARMVHCHCSLCRRSRGTAFATTVLAPLALFRWTRARIAYATTACRRRAPIGRTSARAAAVCCRACCPSLAMAMLPAGAIDTALEIEQAVHIYVGSKAGVAGHHRRGPAVRGDAAAGTLRRVLFVARARVRAAIISATDRE